MDKNKGGRTPLASGHEHIRNAKALFDASMAKGKPNFWYVALAIGQVPIKPPRWAIRACIDEKLRIERKAAAVDADPIGRVLDEMVRVFYDFEEITGRDGSVLKLATAIKEATRRTELFLGDYDQPKPSEMRTIERAWNREQDETVSDSSLVLEGYKPTERIDRVLIARLGEEFGMSTNPMQDLWDHENPAGGRDPK